MRARATNEEFIDLLAAVGRNCSCPVGPLTGRVILCPAHHLIEEEQALCRLVFYRRYASALLRGEWAYTSGWTRSGGVTDIGVL